MASALISQRRSRRSGALTCIAPSTMPNRRGVEIRACKSAVPLYPLGSLDERVNERPLEVDFGRRGGRHLIFGASAHSCIGSQPAKRDLRLFLEEWLSRIPDFRLAPGTRPKTKTGLANVVEELHLVWDR